MASYKRRQSSDYNQSVPETQFVPEQHAYQEKHFQPLLNQPVSESHAETEYGATVTPDEIESRADRGQHTTYTEQSDQPGEDDMAKMQVRQNLQNNSDPGTQYSTPDVSSGVSSGPGGFATYGGGAAAGTTAATTTVVASSAAATVSSVAITTVGAAVIAATLILPLVIGVPSAIIFDEISVTDTTVYYSIYFEDYEEDMELYVSLHNNFTDRSHKVESHSISVLEENLKPGMDYKLTVYGSLGTVLDERTVTTDKEPTNPTFNVDAAEFSMSDGLIHLSATLDDPRGSYSDFSMVFYDVKGNVRTEIKRVSVTDFNNEITMLPGLATDTYVDGILAVECMSGTESKVLYEKEMTAYSNLYIGFKAPPRVMDGKMTVECIIVDTESVRSNYNVTAIAENVDNRRESWNRMGALVDGSVTFESVTEYPFQEGYVIVEWDGTGSGDPLYYNYNTLTPSVTMKNEITSYQGTDYEVKFEVEMILNDYSNYLTDSSGVWRTDKYPEFTSNSSQSQFTNTFYDIRRTGDNTYVAVFLAENWYEAVTYRLDNTLVIGTGEINVPTFTSYNKNVTIYREVNEDMSVKLAFSGPSGTTIGSASLIGSDGIRIACTISSSGNEFYFTTDYKRLDLNDTYSIYFYDSYGNVFFREDGLKFENPPVMTSAINNTGNKILTAVFDYSGTNVTMIGTFPSQPTVTATGETLTLEFGMMDPNIATGEEYFVFESSGTITYQYYWKAVFQDIY